MSFTLRNNINFSILKEIINAEKILGPNIPSNKVLFCNYFEPKLFLSMSIFQTPNFSSNLPEGFWAK